MGVIFTPAVNFNGRVVGGCGQVLLGLCIANCKSSTLRGISQVREDNLYFKVSKYKEENVGTGRRTCI